MKSPLSLPYWNCLTSKAVLSPWTQWALQLSIAAQIQQAQADYILCLKANHPTMFEQLDAWFKTACASGTLPIPTDHTTVAGHHRTEIRSCGRSRSTNCPPCITAEEWMGLQTIVIVERTRYLWNKTTHEIQFYLSSLPSDSPRIAGAIRQHWGIENSLHSLT